MTLRDFVATILALERGQPVVLPVDWVSVRTSWLQRLMDDPGARSEYRVCYEVLASEGEESADAFSPAPVSAQSAADAGGEHEPQIPHVERVMASFQLLERTSDRRFDPDATGLLPLPPELLPLRAAAPPSSPFDPDATQPPVRGQGLVLPFAGTTTPGRLLEIAGPPNTAPGPDAGDTAIVPLPEALRKPPKGETQ